MLNHRAWLAHAPLEVISKPASIDVYALEHCDALLSIAAPENTDDGAAAAGVGLGSTATRCPGCCAGIRRLRSPKRTAWPCRSSRTFSTGRASSTGRRS